MGIVQEPGQKLCRILAVGFNRAEARKLTDVGSGAVLYPDPDFNLVHHDEIEFSAAIIDQRLMMGLQYGQARYLVGLARKIPLLAYVDDAMFFESRNCPCIPDGLVFRSRKDLLADACRLGAAGYWILPGQLEWRDLLLGKPRAELCAGFCETDWAFLKHLIEGWENNRIARAHDMSLSEVKTRLLNIYQSLGVENRTQAAIVAFYLSFDDLPVAGQPTTHPSSDLDNTH